MDSESAEAYCALGQLYRITDWAWDRALEYSQRAAELDPSDSHFQSLCGLCLSYQGRLPEAERYAQRAIELDPINPLAYMSLGTILLIDRRFDDIDQLIGESIEKFENHLLLLLVRALASLFRGDGENAVKDANMMVETSGRNPIYIATAGTCCAIAGDTEGAEAYLAEIRNHPNPELIQASGKACLLQCLRGRDEAFPLFQEAYRKREFGLLWFSRIGYFSLPPFKGDARLSRLIDRIGIR